jgi:bifunctional non-homologous end joining protein LigD
VSARSNTHPAFIQPELATLVSEPPKGDEWLHEMKFDGYRLECLLERGRARLITRSGLDWTDRFPNVAEAAAAIPARSAVLDGEVVVLLPDGRSSFRALQLALKGEPSGPMVYFAFDLLALDGKDLRRFPLIERKDLLADLLHGRRRGSRVVRFSEHVEGHGDTVYARACKAGLEGIISKRSDSPYSSARTRAWLKVKCVNRQEFVVVGFTEPKGGRGGFGALLLGVHNGKRLTYAGKVGTGFSDALLRDTRRELEGLIRKEPTVDAGPDGRRAHWVEPKKVAEVVFTEWTDDGRLRHPAFVGFREDKPARHVRRERVAK